MTPDTTNMKGASATSVAPTLQITSFTIPSGQELLMVGVGAGNSLQTSRTVTGVSWSIGPQSLTQVPSSSADDGIFCRSALWYLLNPTAGTGTITITYGDNGSGGYFAAAVSFDGADTGTPLGTAVTATSTSTDDPTLGSVTNASGNYFVSVTATDNDSSITESGTLVAEAQGLGSDVSCSMQYHSTVNPTPSWTGSGQNGWGASGVEVKAAGGGDVSTGLSGSAATGAAGTQVPNFQIPL